MSSFAFTAFKLRKDTRNFKIALLFSNALLRSGSSRGLQPRSRNFTSADIRNNNSKSKEQSCPPNLTVRLFSTIRTRLTERFKADTRNNNSNPEDWKLFLVSGCRELSQKYLALMISERRTSGSRIVIPKFHFGNNCGKPYAYNLYPVKIFVGAPGIGPGASWSQNNRFAIF
jgi:hypothetical protein